MATARRQNNVGAEDGPDNLLTLVAIALLGLIALGGGAAAAARALRRRRPRNSPFTAGGANLAEALSEADAVLEGLDFDAELRSMLAQQDGAEREEVAEIERSAEVVSTPG